MKPFISIIIPTLNEEKYIPKLLEDLKKQKKKNFELIVVDADSDDQTVKSVASFKKTFRSLSIYELRKRDVVYQKNYGAKKAQGKYLVFIDADSRVNPTLTQRLEEELKKSKYTMYLPTMLPQGGTSSDRVLFKIANFLVELSQNWPKPFITIGLMVFEKGFFDHLGGYKNPASGKPNTLSEDHDIILRGIKSGARVKFLRRVKVRFSLRRMKKEGRFNVIRKYIVSGLELMVTGKREAKLDYEMGGHVHEPSQKSKNQEQDEMWDQIRKFVKKV